MSRMSNVTGSPVEGDDFFDRPQEVRRVQRQLDSGGSILYTAPRRVGKTSLVLKVCELRRKQNWCAVYFNVEGCGDELEFAEKLVEELMRAGLNPDALNRASTIFKGMRRLLGGTKIGLKGPVGLDVQIGGAEDGDTVGRIVESICRQIEEESKKVLIAIDEVPTLLIAISKQENGAERVARLLHWLRSLRQTYRKQIHWIFLGSIGLDGFVDDRNMRAAINDLTIVHLAALSDPEARDFLTRLGDDNGLPIPTESRELIIRKIGWALPHHLQMVFQSLQDLEVTQVDAQAVEDAFAFLLQPESRSQFDTWRQRLEIQLDAVSARVAKDILRHLCQHPDGRTRAQLLDALMLTRPQADAGEVEEHIARLLQLLQRDGYLLTRADGCYTFRSFLLREYWKCREVQ